MSSEENHSFNSQQIEAAEEFLNSAIELLGNGREFHAPTTIAAIARMAGTFLFRSFEFKLESAEPGQPVLSHEANEEGSRLMQITGSVLAHLGIALDEEQFVESTNPEDKPSLGFLETQRQLEPIYLRIKDRLALSFKEAAESAAIASAMLIQQSSNSINSNTAFGIAVYGFIEGTKTVPDPVAI